MFGVDHGGRGYQRLKNSSPQLLGLQL